MATTTITTTRVRALSLRAASRPQLDGTKFRAESRPQLNDKPPFRSETPLESPLALQTPNQQYVFVPQFELECGVILHNVRVAYIAHGRLNARRDNAVVVCHAFSGSADAQGDWWKPMYMPGASLGTEDLFVICLNVLGSPYGTTSPLTYRDENPELGRWGAQFPCTSIRDDVRLHKQALELLGVQQVAMVIGGSMGGMHSLEWAFIGQEFVRSIVTIACGPYQSAWAIGWNEIQRSVIQQDPRFCYGLYDPRFQPSAGMAAARMAAMLTYRAPGSLERRFGRKKQHEHQQQQREKQVPQKDNDTLGTHSDASQFAVEGYLNYQGAKFNRRFDANCYIALTRKTDTHDIGRGRTDPALAQSARIEQALQQIRQPMLVVGVNGDVLYPLEEQRQLGEHIPCCQFESIESDDGHDAFLLEFEELNRHIGTFMRRCLPEFCTPRPEGLCV